jgi:hypothetical protein
VPNSVSLWDYLTMVLLFGRAKHTASKRYRIGVRCTQMPRSVKGQWWARPTLCS